MQDIYLGNDESSDMENEAPSTPPQKRGREVMEEDEAPGEDEENLPTAEVAEQPPPDPLRRRKLQVLIRAYANRFKTRLEGVDFTNLDKSQEELEQDLRDIRFLISASSPGAPMKLVCDIGVTAWEKLLAEGMDYQVTGLSVYLKRDQEWKDLVDEMALEYADVFEQPIHYRVGFKLLQASYMLHSMNSAERAAAFTAPVSAATQQKWQGL